MDYTLAKFQEIKNKIEKDQKARRDAWAATYPSTVQLEEKHFVWDYDVEVDGLLPQIEDWLSEHAVEDYSMIFRTIGFKDADTALHFRVRWS